MARMTFTLVSETRRESAIDIQKDHASSPCRLIFIHEKTEDFINSHGLKDAETVNDVRCATHDQPRRHRKKQW